MISTFASKVRTKRGGRTLRMVAKQVGIAPSTFSHMEHGGVPDIRTFALLQHWLGSDCASLLSLALRGRHRAGR